MPLENSALAAETQVEAVQFAPPIRRTEFAIVGYRNEQLAVDLTVLDS